MSRCFSFPRDSLEYITEENTKKLLYFCNIKQTYKSKMQNDEERRKHEY